MSTDPALKSLLEEHFPRTCSLIRLADHTTWRIGGMAVSLAVTDAEALQASLAFLDENGIPWLILGMGSNVLAPSEGCGHVIVRLTGDLRKAVFSRDGRGWRIEAGGGAHLPSLAGAACMQGAGGLEFAVGIPGTVGGAVFMNAGAYERSISDTVESITVLDPSGRRSVLHRKNCLFGYRQSRFQEEPLVVESITMRLDECNAAVLRRRASEILELRRGKFPLNLPNAGSVFRRPEGEPPPGWLIERSGLKGFEVGGAMVSTLHANFIVNTGGATSDDVIGLISLVREKVREDTGIELMEEIRYIPGPGEMG